MNSNKILPFIMLILLGIPAFSHGNIEPNSESELPLRRLALFSSGVGFFEHSGRISSTVASPFELTLPFNISAINDALASLTINDPVSQFPTVRYASANTLYQTLRSLAVDLSGNPGIADILGNMRGTEIEIYAPSLSRGRIIGIEHRRGSRPSGEWTVEPWLSLFTPQGIRSIAISDITSFSFIDEKINADLERALDLLVQGQDWEKRNLLLSLPGEGSRNVSLSYVIPVPVWKVSYRLDLSGARPFLQGWAIIDNDSDMDWDNVELSLVAGRPVSFTQNLYAPYRNFRPELPLAIAGVAESRVYESGSFGRDMGVAPEAEVAEMQLMRVAPMAAPAPQVSMNDMAWTTAPQPTRAAVAGGTVQTAQAGIAGDHFEFTLRRPVTIQRHQSAMLPLVESQVTVEKLLVFSGSQAGIGRSINPAISAELTNTSGMRLPAGPITVYDGGTYAGDALIEFFPEDEKRLISYADDLSVSGSVSSSSNRLVTTVTVSGGVMTINRRQDYERVYSIRNASNIEKNLIIEHPITQGTNLGEPVDFDERTPSLYRFRLPLPANREINFQVREEQPLSERITLAQLRPEAFLSYSTNQEIPAHIRNALARAMELWRGIDEANQIQQDLENQRSRLISEQDRIRRNLEAAGNQSPQGQEYLRQMAAMDGEINGLNTRINQAIGNVQTARREYNDYIANLELR